MELVIELNMYSATPALVRLGTDESYGYETLRLVRGEGWQDLEIIVSFTPARNNRAINVLVDSNDTVNVPPEFTSKFGTRNIVVIGKADGKQLVSCDIIAYIEEHATADDVATGKTIVDKTGAVIAGAMPMNGAVEKTLDIATPSYTIDKGNHNGKGVVRIVPEEKTVTPSKKAQDITPTTGKVISKVTVEAIPDEYQDVTKVTATAADVLAGKKIVGTDGSVIEGAISVNGAIAKTLNAMTDTEVSIPAGYTTGGKVSLTDDLENALAAI